MKCTKKKKQKRKERKLQTALLCETLADEHQLHNFQAKGRQPHNPGQIAYCPVVSRAALSIPNKTIVTEGVSKQLSPQHSSIYLQLYDNEGPQSDCMIVLLPRNGDHLPTTRGQVTRD